MANAVDKDLRARNTVERSRILRANGRRYFDMYVGWYFDPNFHTYIFIQLKKEPVGWKFDVGMNPRTGEGKLLITKTSRAYAKGLMRMPLDSMTATQFLLWRLIIPGIPLTGEITGSVAMVYRRYAIPFVPGQSCLSWTANAVLAELMVARLPLP